MSNKWIEIDGSHGEGGGQILRTALSLAAILGKKIRISNIRAGRRKPGLQPQHLTGVRAVAEICEGKLKGDKLSSQAIEFEPGEIKSGHFEFDVMKVKSSAGSTGMIFQQIAPVLAFAKEKSTVTLKGGTHTAWAPPVDYLERVLLPTLFDMGFHAKLEIVSYGWYPMGQGEVRAIVHPIKDSLSPLTLIDRGNLRRITGTSVVSNLPMSIAERQKIQAWGKLKDHKLVSEIKCVSAQGIGAGTSILLVAEFENSLAGFSALGKRGKPAEDVADEAVNELLKYYKSKMCIEKHLSDQLILYMALAEGKSSFTVSEISNHLLTNIWVAEQFLKVKFEVKGNIGQPGEVSVEGTGFGG